MSQQLSVPWLSIVIPAYNEERRLPGTLAGVASFVGQLGRPCEIIVVDDGSDDGTSAAVEKFSTHHPYVRCLPVVHRGKGCAVREGMLAARGDYVLFMDADLAVPMRAADDLVLWLKAGYDVAIGSREGIGAARIGEPLTRRLMGRVFNLAVQLLAVAGIRDTQCGFKLFRREAAHHIFSRMVIHGPRAEAVQGGRVTAFDVEVLFLAHKLGYRVKEVPVLWRYGTESKVSSLKDSYYNFMDVLKVRLYDWRGVYRGAAAPPAEEAWLGTQGARR
ncbi:MAG: glycosyltransferase family 2 protein [Bacteroidetes bacterium]|nr:glycosyltransferase family 2 protein [Bacteroidota bacterium]